MARNKRKHLKDKDKMKAIRREAKKRWRARKKLKAAIGQEAREGLERQAEEISKEMVPEETGFEDNLGEDKRPHQNETKDFADEPCRKDNSNEANVEGKGDEEHGVDDINKETTTIKPEVNLHGMIKEISPCEVIKSTTCLGSGNFGSCYLAKYRGIKVAVKEYHHKNTDESLLKKEVLHEASVLSRLGDHPGLPLLFGISTLRKPYRLITQFHGEEKRSLTLLKAIKKVSLTNKEWLRLMKNVTLALTQVHGMGFLHNDIKTNNVVLERRGDSYNPVIVDFGKARRMDSPKSRKLLPLSEQRAYLKKYPHVAPEIPRGKGTQSTASDVFSLGYMFIQVKEVMGPTSSQDIHLLSYNLKMAVHDIPSRRPSLRNILSVLSLLYQE